METVADAPTLRALLGRRDLHLRLEGDGRRSTPALSTAVRWVHSSDLADPTPFLSEGLALLTTGTQFQDAGDDARRLRATTSRRLVGPRRGRTRLRHRGGARRHPAAAGRRVPRRADAAVRGALPHAVHRGRARRRRGDRRAVVRAAQLGARRAAGDLPRRAAARRTRRDARRTGPPARRLGGHVRRGGHAHARASIGRSSRTRRTSCSPRSACAARGARAPHRRFASATCPFTLQTLGRGGHLRGVIAMAAGDLDQEGRGVVTAVVAMAGLALEQQQGLDRARHPAARGTVHSLRSDDPALARRISPRPVGRTADRADPVAADRCRAGRRDALREWLELHADERRGGLFFGRGDDGGLVLVVGAPDAALLEECAERFDVRIGISDPTTYDAFSAGIDQARLARDRGTGLVSHFADAARTGVLSVAADGRGAARSRRRRSRRSCATIANTAPRCSTRCARGSPTTARTRRPRAPSVCTATPSAPGSRRRSARWTSTSGRSPRAPSSGRRCASPPRPRRNGMSHGVPRGRPPPRPPAGRLACAAGPPSPISSPDVEPAHRSAPCQVAHRGRRVNTFHVSGFRARVRRHHRATTARPGKDAAQMRRTHGGSRPMKTLTSRHTKRWIAATAAAAIGTLALAGCGRTG